MKFQYKALSSDGRVLDEELEAASRGAAIEQIKQLGHTLLDLKCVQEAASKQEARRFPTLGFAKISAQQKAFFFRQLGELIDAGLPIVTAFESFSKFCGSDALKKMLENVSGRIQSGENLSVALAAQDGVFSKVDIAMVEVGEKTGQLSEILIRIADLQEIRMELRGKIRSALSYPIFVFGFTTLLCWVLVTFLLPSFEPIWKGAKLDMSSYPVTEVLLKLSALSRSPVDEVVIVVLTILVTLVFFRMVQEEQIKDSLGKALLKVPVLGHYLQLTSTSEVCSTLGTLLESGMSLVDALDITAGTTTHPAIGQGLQAAAVRVREGNGLASSLEETQVFPELFIQMVGVGEVSGDLPRLLSRVSKYYRFQLDESLKNLTALIEPITMLVIGGVVFLFVIGVFLPIMGIVSALSNQVN